ncbi:zf-TFIIB domain-containing protein [Acaryochloris sp. IP29b_bin.148]|uniref:zf-TFIIB domain-containing protein n=1 Tax=Acaryochloris sp. IP29b_bin.148 TaxID=2969218 RepID=UPI0026310536|nr:zf-TFIIB domain-containing protein [Acaryochloris sp. IP29b_bin.148]
MLKLCPVCRTPQLSKVLLESNLPAFACPRCEGEWISADDYWAWLEHQDDIPPEPPADGPPLQVSDNQQATLCPDCRCLMLKYRVGHELSFYLDQCSRCQGLWFDKNEWASLKRRGLHDEVHKVFSAPWQAKIRANERQKKVDQVYLNTIGAEDYVEAQRVKQWLDQHPQRDVLLSFLNSG